MNGASTHFLPDPMKWSNSTAILQDRAWRLWAAEQLVLTTLPVNKGGAVKGPSWLRDDYRSGGSRAHRVGDCLRAPQCKLYPAAGPPPSAPLAHTGIPAW